MHSIRTWVFGCVGCGLIAAVLGLLYQRRATPTQHSESAHTELPAADSAPGDIMAVEHASFGHGRWYVTDARSHRLHVLDSAGQMIRSIGRRGRGPGEFIVPHRVAVGANRIFVSELGRPAISVFDSAGTFLHYLRARGSCPSGRIEAMSAPGADLFVLRRCMELPERVRFQVERSIADGRLEIWPIVADTTLISKGSAVPLDLPLFSVSANRLALGNGNVGCFRIFRLSDGGLERERCLDELERRVLPRAEWERLARKARGRLAIPDSLPRVVNLVLLDSTVLVQAVESFDTSRWLELPLVPREPRRVRELGSASAAPSFVSGRTRLIAWEEANGIRIEVVRLER